MPDSFETLYHEIKPAPGEDVSSRLEPCTAGAIKDKDWIISDKDGTPCTVSDITTSKTGKHGHIKVSYKGSNPFTNRNYIASHPHGYAMFKPRMERREYTVIDYHNDELTLLKENDSLTIDLKEDSSFGVKIKDLFEKDEGDIVVATLIGPQRKSNGKVVLIEMIESCKVIK